jgi:hypothetical protein
MDWQIISVVVTVVIAVAGLAATWWRRREAKKQAIWSLDRNLEGRQVLSEEGEVFEGEFYGHPERMIESVKEIRSAIDATADVLRRNHKDISILDKMTESCKKFLEKVESSEGSETFFEEIREPQKAFRESLKQKVAELKDRNGIPS